MNQQPQTASDAAFAFVCIVLSVMALYFLVLGFHLGQVAS